MMMTLGPQQKLHLKDYPVRVATTYLGKLSKEFLLFANFQVPSHGSLVFI